MTGQSLTAMEIAIAPSRAPPRIRAMLGRLHRHRTLLRIRNAIRLVALLRRCRVDQIQIESRKFGNVYSYENGKACDEHFLLMPRLLRDPRHCATAILHLCIQRQRVSYQQLSRSTFFDCGHSATFDEAVS